MDWFAKLSRPIYTKTDPFIAFGAASANVSDATAQFAMLCGKHTELKKHWNVHVRNIRMKGCS